MEKVKFVGIISAVTYVGENNYAILKANLKSYTGDKPEKLLATKKIITLVGTISQPIKGAVIVANGSWVYDTTYKEVQFSVDSSYVDIDKESYAAAKYIMDCIGGGVTIANQIIDTFGSDIPSLMEQPDRLLQISKINRKKLDSMKANYVMNKSLFDIYILTGGECTKKQAIKILNKYGDKSGAILKHNPYIMAQDINGFGFIKADKIAQALGFKYDCYERIYAGITCCIKQASSESGHCFLYENEVKDIVGDFLLPLSSMQTIYFNDVLGTSVPSNTLQWKETPLYEIIAKHKSVMQNMIDKWGNDRDRESYSKKYNLGSDEIDCIDKYINKKIYFARAIDDILLAEAYNVSGIPVSEIEKTLYTHTGLDRRLIAKKDSFGAIRYYERETFLLELNVCKSLIEISKKPIFKHMKKSEIETLIHNYEIKNNMTLGQEQKDAVEMALTHRLSIITGGPGRGKTTIENLIKDGWLQLSTDDSEEFVSYYVLPLAPTGRASQRMTEALNAGGITESLEDVLKKLPPDAAQEDYEQTINEYERLYPTARTIHREIKYFFSQDNTVARPATMIFIDEASMIDLRLMKALLKYGKDSHFVFIGDADQLPCVGIGDIFKDMIKSGCIPCTVLKTCYRSTGSINANVDRIKEQTSLDSFEKDHMFKLITFNNQDGIDAVIQQNAVTIYGKMLEKYDKKDIEIIVPLKKNRKTSSFTLNKLIQEKYNPHVNGKQAFMNHITGEIFRIGDRVLHTKNDYHLEGLKNGKPIMGVFNGETGEITNIVYRKHNNDEIKEDKPALEVDVDDCDSVDENETPEDIKNVDGYVEVLFDDGKLVKYPFSKTREMELAYAVTTHKSQGSEYKCIITIFVPGDYMLLFNNTIYTAVSRGKEMVVLLGTKSAITKAIFNTNHEVRHTSSAEFLIDFSKQIL